MAGSNLSVKITADTADLAAKFAIARAEVTALASELNKLAKQSAAGVLDGPGQAQLQQIAGDLVHAKDAAKTLSDQFKETSTSGHGLGGALDEIKGKLSSALQFTGIGAAVAGVTELAESIGNLADGMKLMRSSAEVLGVTIAQFQAMGVAADEAGVSQQQFTSAQEQLLRILDEARKGSSAAADKLLSLGISAQQINNPLFGLVQMMGVLRDRLNDPSIGRAEITAMLDVLSRKLADTIPAFRAFDGSLVGVAGNLAKVNGVSDETAEHVSEMGTRWNLLKTYITNTTATWLESVATIAKAGALGPTFKMPGVDTSEALAKWKEFQGVVEQINGQVTVQSLAAERAQVAATAEGSTERVALAKKYLKDARELYDTDEVDAVREAKKQEIEAERSYARDVERMVTESAAMSREAQARVTQGKEQERALDEKIEASRLASLQTVADAQVAAAERGLTAQIAAIHAAAAAHQISATQERDQTIAASNAELQTVITTLQEMQSHYPELSEKWMAIQKLMVEISQKGGQQQVAATAKAAQDMMNEWSRISSGLAGEFNSVFTNMTQRGMSFTSAMKNMFADMGSHIVQTLIKIAVQYEINAMISKATGMAAAKSNVMAHAAEAASAAMASAAAIPYIGWLIAPIEGAAIYAAALAFPMAEQGFDVPAGINPMTQLHAQEMVLPAPLANVVRRAAGPSGDSGSLDTGYGPGSSGERGGGDFHFHAGGMHSLDPRSMTQVFSSPSGRRALMAAARRHFSRGGRM